MKEEKILKKVTKRYGTTEINDLTISKIKNLKVNKKKLEEESKKFKLVRKPIKIICKGAGIGASVAGIVDTAFPNLIPVAGSYITSLMPTNTMNKVLSLSILASKPVDLISGYGVISIGACTGAILYTGYKLVKTGINNLQVVSDRHKIKKIQKKNIK